MLTAHVPNDALVHKILWDLTLAHSQKFIHKNILSKLLAICMYILKNKSPYGMCFVTLISTK